MLSLQPCPHCPQWKVKRSAYLLSENRGLNRVHPSEPEFRQTRLLCEVRRFAIQVSLLQQGARYCQVIEAIAHFAAKDFGQDQIFGYFTVFAIHTEAGAVNDPLMNENPLPVIAGLRGLEAARPMCADEPADLVKLPLQHRQHRWYPVPQSMI